MAEAVYLVRLGGLVEHTGLDGCRHQVVCSSDGVNVTSEVKIKLPNKQNSLSSYHLFFHCVSRLPYCHILIWLRFVLKNGECTSSMGMT